jgi:hypothetical protein
MMLALAGAIAVALPAPGVFVAMALAIGAVGTGAVAYRRRGAPGHGRLWGVAALTVGVLVLALAGLRYGLTLAVVDHLETMIDG